MKKTNKKESKTITKNERLCLVGLLTLGREAVEKFEACERAGEKILGLPENSGSHFGDAMFSVIDIDTVLKWMDVKVKKG